VCLCVCACVCDKRVLTCFKALWIGHRTRSSRLPKLSWRDEPPSPIPINMVIKYTVPTQGTSSHNLYVHTATCFTVVSEIKYLRYICGSKISGGRGEEKCGDGEEGLSLQGKSWSFDRDFASYSFGFSFAFLRTGAVRPCRMTSVGPSPFTQRQRELHVVHCLEPSALLSSEYSQRWLPHRRCRLGL